MAFQSLLLLISLAATCLRCVGADVTAEAPTCNDAAAARSESEVEASEEGLFEELDVRLLQTGTRMQARGADSVLEPAAAPSGLMDLAKGMVHGENQPGINHQATPDPNVTDANVKSNTDSGLGGLDGVCFTDDDCCPFTVAGLCDLFCKESQNSEIDTHDIKGWRLKGQCTRKWEGFCTEDEECPPTFFCQRATSELAGTCVRDIACDKVSCGRGRCRDGTCTCDYGVAGERCDRSLEAFAFLYYGNNSENLISTRVLVRSLRAGGAPQDIVAIIPQNMANDTNAEHLEILKADGVLLYFSEPIYMPTSMDKDPIIHKRWSGVMNKFAVWRMTTYSQVALVDTDLVFALDGESPGRIFEECEAPLCAVRDGDPRFMNAGVMVVVPSTQRLEHIIHVLSNEQHHFAMPEQSFLTRYCEVKSNRMELQYLDRKWNSCVGGGMLHNIGWESTGYNVLHSCSWQGKPPSMQLCTPPGCNQEEEFHTVLVWQFFHIQADPCILKADEASCGTVGIHQCQWCGHYCSNAKVYCDAKLFNSTKTRDKDEPSPLETEILFGNRSTTTGLEWPKNDSSAPWHELPRGSWAWPQVAMYQILIDRFAMPNEKHCEKLDDYCGGTIPGIRSKLAYLEQLGVDGVILSPIVTQMPHGYHGYWTKDLTSVNPEYGTEDDVRELVVLLHERKMKAIVDVNLNHAGGPKVNASDPESVSILKPFDKPEFFHDDNCSLMHNEDYDKGPQFLERCKLYGLPDYNHENPRVWQRLMKWVREHVDMYGFDGIRVDAARHIQRSFLDHIPETGPPIPAFFEVVNGEMSYVAGYATGDYSAVYNYPLYFTLKDIFVPALDQSPMSALADYMTDEAPKAGGRLLLNFLDNNDLPRFVYKLDGDMLLYHNALLCMLGMEGLPTLLYGDEQNLRGILNFSDPLKVDNWRPPLWHQGYNTSTSTFQMVRKVLWLRQRMNGLHDYKQRAVYSDHRVMLFSRGPIIFAVTNAGSKAKITSQRVLWDNATAGGPYGQPSWVCNLLAIDPSKDCGVIIPGNITRLHLTGEPKMYVPSEFITEYATFEQKEKQDRQLREQVAASDPKVMPFSEWHEIPNPPLIKAQALKRTARSWRPADVVMHDNPFHVWHPVPKLPPHLDSWAPPVGMPATHVVQASIEDACFYLGAGEKDGAVFAQRGNTTYVLCPDSQEWCPSTVGQNVNLQHLKEVANYARAPNGSLPVVHLTYDVWYGVYHLMVGALPSIAPYLSQLQSGTMRVFFHAGQQMVSPVLSLLGVSKSAFFPPSDPPLAEPYNFCTSRMYFDMSTRPLYPRVEYVPSYLHAFRGALQATEGISRPCGVNTYGIVILSRGNQTRSLRNEPELAAALESLGRPVQIVNPGPYNFLQMVEALSHAEVIVGAHGANLANIIFAPAGVKVVEIVPQVNFDFQDYHFRDLAGALNFTYIPVGQHVREDEYNQILAEDPMTMDKALASYEADIVKVTALVKQALQ